MAAVCTPLTHAPLSGTYLGASSAPAARFSGARRGLWTIGAGCGASAALRRTRGTPLQGPACAASTMSRCRHPSPALPVPVQALPVTSGWCCQHAGSRGKCRCLAARRAGGSRIFVALHLLSALLGQLQTACTQIQASRSVQPHLRCHTSAPAAQRKPARSSIKLLPIRQAAVAAPPRRLARPTCGPPAGAKLHRAAARFRFMQFLQQPLTLIAIMATAAVRAPHASSSAITDGVSCQWLAGKPGAETSKQKKQGGASPQTPS